MLDSATIKKINDFVYTKPRSIQEIAQHIKANWRTADRYVEKIMNDQGTLSIRTFREGTRGALKVIYWNNIEKMHASEMQEWLFKRIESGRRIQDFSALDIFQFVDDKKKKMRTLTAKQHDSDENFNDFANLLQSAENQILFFSGNMTFSKQQRHDRGMRQVIEELAKKKVSSKVLTRVELPGIENVMDVAAINKKVGWDAVEIRHCFQPLRVTIIDSKVAVMKEVLKPDMYADGELKQRMVILYYIYDEDWIAWLQKVFWNLFRSSVDYNTRIKEIKKML